MRIISGKYGGRKINPPAGFRARPTTDYARESLFNVLSNRVDFEEIEVLDLFAGTGSLSYEFASRGAVTVHSVERDSRHLSFIRQMVNELGIGNIKLVHVDVKAFLKACTYKYDLVFADPPYDLNWLGELPELVTGAGIIKPEGFFILEHPKNITFIGNKYFFEHRHYGNVNFSFFK